MLATFQCVRAEPRLKLDKQMRKNSYPNVNVTDDREHETSGEVTVGIGENQNGFGVKVIDDGEGEDVTNGEAVNVKHFGDGEADDGDDDVDNNEGDLFFRHVMVRLVVRLQ